MVSINVKLQKVIKILVCFSLFFLTFFLCNNTPIYLCFVSGVLSSLIGIVFLFFINKGAFKNINIRYLSVSMLYAIFILYKLLSYDYKVIVKLNSLLINHNFYGLNQLVIFCVFVAILPALIGIIYNLFNYLFKKVFNFFKSLTRSEKRILIVIMVIGFLANFIISLLTPVFYSPVSKGNIISYDVVYTSDSGYLYNYDAHINPNNLENDIRNPLYAIFALPFSITTEIISTALFFIPNAFIVFYKTIEIMLITLMFIMFAKILNLDTKREMFFVIFALSTYSCLLYSLLFEQYVVSTFYLVLVIYRYFSLNDNVNYSYIGAVGTLITSGIVFPLISKWSSWKKYVENVWICFLAFLFVTVITGQIYKFIIAKDTIKNLMGFAGGNISLIDKFYQYLYFVRSIFIAPKANVIGTSYFQIRIDFVSIIGIILLCICFVSTIINHKNKLSKISSLFTIFSFLILTIVGWGTIENGLILYSLYFGWAFILLVYMFFDKIFKNKKLLNILIVLLSLIMLGINITEIINIIKFGISIY